MRHDMRISTPRLPSAARPRVPTEGSVASTRPDHDKPVRPEAKALRYRPHHPLLVIASSSVEEVYAPRRLVVKRY